MIIVSGVFEVEGADRDAAIAAAVRMATETRKEEGCQSYAFYGDFEDADRIRVFEEWESGEALERHFKTPHMAEFSTEPRHGSARHRSLASPLAAVSPESRAALGKIRIKRGGVFRYEVTAKTPLG